MLFSFKEKTKNKKIYDAVLEKIYLQVMNELNDVYVPGTEKYIETQCKDLDGEIRKADGHINVIWKTCNEGKSSIGDFNMALEDFKSLYLKGINIFRKQQASNGTFSGTVKVPNEIAGGSV
jgi:hypothetical protein